MANSCLSSQPETAISLSQEAVQHQYHLLIALLHKLNLNKSANASVHKTLNLAEKGDNIHTTWTRHNVAGFLEQNALICLWKCDRVMRTCSSAL